MITRVSERHARVAAFRRIFVSVMVVSAVSQSNFINCVASNSVLFCVLA